MTSTLWDHAPVPDFGPARDPDREETRGRPKKERIEGAKTVPVELTPSALTSIEEVKRIRRLVPGGVPSRSEIICHALANHVERVEREVRAAAEYLAEVLPVADLRAARSLPAPAWVPVTLDPEANAAIQVLYDYFTKQGRMFRDQGELIGHVLKESSAWAKPHPDWIAVPVNSEATAALDILKAYYGKAARKLSRGQLAAQIIRDAATSVVTAHPTSAEQVDINKEASSK